VHHQGTLPQLPTLGSCDRKKKKLHQLLLDPSAIAVAMQGATCGCKSDCFDAVMRQNGSRTVHLIVEQRRVSLGSDVPKLVAELRRHYDTASGTLNAPFPLFGGDGGIPSVCRPVLYFLLAVSQHRARAVHALLASGTAGAVPSRGAALFERAVAFWTLVLEDGSEDQPHEPGVSAASTDGNVLQWKSRITDVAWLEKFNVEQRALTGAAVARDMAYFLSAKRHALSTTGIREVAELGVCADCGSCVKWAGEQVTLASAPTELAAAKAEFDAHTKHVEVIRAHMNVCESRGARCLLDSIAAGLAVPIAFVEMDGAGSFKTTVPGPFDLLAATKTRGKNPMFKSGGGAGCKLTCEVAPISGYGSYVGTSPPWLRGSTDSHCTNWIMLLLLLASGKRASKDEQLAAHLELLGEWQLSEALSAVGDGDMGGMGFLRKDNPDKNLETAAFMLYSHGGHTYVKYKTSADCFNEAQSGCLKTGAGAWRGITGEPNSAGIRMFPSITDAEAVTQVTDECSVGGRNTFEAAKGLHSVKKCIGQVLCKRSDRFLGLGAAFDAYYGCSSQQHLPAFRRAITLLRKAAAQRRRAASSVATASASAAAAGTAAAAANNGDGAGPFVHQQRPKAAEGRAKAARGAATAVAGQQGADAAQALLTKEVIIRTPHDWAKVGWPGLLLAKVIGTADSVIDVIFCDRTTGTPAAAAKTFKAASNVWVQAGHPESGPGYKTFMVASIAFLCEVKFKNPRAPGSAAALNAIGHRDRIPTTSVLHVATLTTGRKLAHSSKATMLLLSRHRDFPACLLGAASSVLPAAAENSSDDDHSVSASSSTSASASSTGGASASSSTSAETPPHSALPAKFISLTDAGCGNWSVAQLQFWAFLVAAGVIDEAEWWRLPVGHTHRKADAVIAAFARAHAHQKNGKFAPTDGYVGHEQQIGSPQHFLRSMPHVFKSPNAWAATPESLITEVERVVQFRDTLFEDSDEE